MFFKIKNATTIHLLLLSSFIFISGMENSMPVSLYNKLHEKQIHPKCAFLASVHEGDYNAVNWMLQNHPIPEGKNPHDYFSIYASEIFRDNVIPAAIAAHRNDHAIAIMLLPFIPISHTVRPFIEHPDILDCLYGAAMNGFNRTVSAIMDSLDSDPGRIDGPVGPSLFYKRRPLYALYLAACSKNLAACTEKISSLEPSDNAHSSFIQCLLLIVIMNNDTQGLKLIKNLVFNKNKNELHNWLGMTFTLAVGLGNNKASFSTEDEIKELMNYPLLKDKKPTLLKVLNAIALAAYCHNYDMFNNPQIKKATQILCDAIESEQERSSSDK